MKYNPPEGYKTPDRINRHMQQVQFCDCYDHDFRKAVVKLVEIVGNQPINDSIKNTARMYVKTAHEIDIQRYIKKLEQENSDLREENRKMHEEHFWAK